MAPWFQKTSFVIALPLLLNGCASTPSKTVEVEMLQDVQVTSATGETKTVHRGESLPMGNDPLKLEAPGFEPLTVLPTKTGTRFQVGLVPVEKTAANGAQVNQILGEVETELLNIQALVSQSRTDEALNKVQDLRRQYPYLTFLKFTEASCWMIKGERARAASLLKDGLEEFPTNKSAKTLYRSLAGEKDGEKK